MRVYSDQSELAPALADLQDAFARVRAQVHVLRLAMGGIRDEQDIRAVLSYLSAIEEELSVSESMVRLHGTAPN
jgi:hypothetical protein